VPGSLELLSLSPLVSRNVSRGVREGRGVCSVVEEAKEPHWRRLNGCTPFWHVHEEIAEGGDGVLYVLRTISHDGILAPGTKHKCRPSAFTPLLQPHLAVFPYGLNIDQDRTRGWPAAAIALDCRDQVSSIKAK
jgi:hypothetical protein